MRYVQGGRGKVRGLASSPPECLDWEKLRLKGVVGNYGEWMDVLERMRHRWLLNYICIACPDNSQLLAIISITHRTHAYIPPFVFIRVESSIIIQQRLVTP